MNAESLLTILEEEEVRMLNLACDSESCYILTNEYDLVASHADSED